MICNKQTIQCHYCACYFCVFVCARWRPTLSVPPSMYPPTHISSHTHTHTCTFAHICALPSSYLAGGADGWRGAAAWKVEAWLIDEVLVPRGSNHVISSYWLTVPIERLPRLCHHVCELDLARIQNLLHSNVIWVGRSSRSTRQAARREDWHNCWRFATLPQFSAPIPHYLAFISIIMIEKLIQLYCNCITWLMIQTPWNLNRASTWVSIANEHFFSSLAIMLYSDFAISFHISDFRWQVIITVWCNSHHSHTNTQRWVLWVSVKVFLWNKKLKEHHLVFCYFCNGYAIQTGSFVFVVSKWEVETLSLLNITNR